MKTTICTKHSISGFLLKLSDRSTAVKHCPMSIRRIKKHCEDFGEWVKHLGRRKGCQGAWVPSETSCSRRWH